MYTNELFALNIGWILLTFSTGLLISFYMTKEKRYFLASIIAILSWYLMRIAYFAGGMGIALDNQAITTDPGLPMTFIFRLVAGAGGFSLNTIIPFEINKDAVLTGLGAGAIIFIIFWGASISIINRKTKKALLNNPIIDSLSIDESDPDFTSCEINSSDVPDPNKSVLNKYIISFFLLAILGLILTSLSVNVLSGPLKPFPLTSIELQKIDQSKLPWSPINMWSNMERKNIPHVGNIDISKNATADNIPLEYESTLNFMAIDNNNTWGSIIVRTQYGKDGQYAKLGNYLSLNNNQLNQLSAQYKSDVLKSLQKNKSLIDWYSPQIVSVNGMNAVWVCYRIQGTPMGTSDRRPMTVWEFHFPNYNREHILYMSFQEFDLQWWYLMSTSLNSFRITEIQ